MVRGGKGEVIKLRRREQRKVLLNGLRVNAPRYFRGRRYDREAKKVSDGGNADGVLMDRTRAGVDFHGGEYAGSPESIRDVVGNDACRSDHRPPVRQRVKF